MEDTPPIIRDKLPADGIGEPVREKMGVEVDKGVGCFPHVSPHQIDVFSAFFSFLASFFSLGVLPGFFFVSFLTSLSLPMTHPPLSFFSVGRSDITPKWPAAQ
jgi:hypothetical protein